MDELRSPTDDELKIHALRKELALVDSKLKWSLERNEREWQAGWDACADKVRRALYD